jgi:hypothetical protein
VGAHDDDARATACVHDQHDPTSSATPWPCIYACGVSCVLDLAGVCSINRLADLYLPVPVLWPAFPKLFQSALPRSQSVYDDGAEMSVSY